MDSPRASASLIVSMIVLVIDAASFQEVFIASTALRSVRIYSRSLSSSMLWGEWQKNAWLPPETRRGWWRESLDEAIPHYGKNLTGMF